jgi:hypothetical protein
MQKIMPDLLKLAAVSAIRVILVNIVNPDVPKGHLDLQIQPLL